MKTIYVIKYIFYDNDSDIKKPCENIRVHKKESLKYALNKRIVWKMSDKYDELKNMLILKKKRKRKKKKRKRKMRKKITMMMIKMIHMK